VIDRALAKDPTSAPRASELAAKLTDAALPPTPCFREAALPAEDTKTAATPTARVNAAAPAPVAIAPLRAQRGTIAPGAASVAAAVGPR
jgi:hypothetical protein